MPVLVEIVEDGQLTGSGVVVLDLGLASTGDRRGLPDDGCRHQLIGNDDGVVDGFLGVHVVGWCYDEVLVGRVIDG